MSFLIVHMDPNQNAFKPDSYEQTKFLLGRNLVVTVTDNQLSPHVSILFGYEPLSQLYVSKYLLLNENDFHSSFTLVHTRNQDICSYSRIGGMAL